MCRSDAESPVTSLSQNEGMEAYGGGTCLLIRTMIADQSLVGQGHYVFPYKK
jgi:hypothetical protein